MCAACFPSFYFPVTCNPSKAVMLSNVGVPHFIGVPHRVTFILPHATFRSSGIERRGRTQSYNSELFKVILLPQRSPRSYIAVIASPLILRTGEDPPASPPTCPLSWSPSRKTCARLPQLFLSKGDVHASPPTFLNSKRRQHVSPNFHHSRKTYSHLLQRSS